MLVINELTPHHPPINAFYSLFLFGETKTYLPFIPMVLFILASVPTITSEMQTRTLLSKELHGLIKPLSDEQDRLCVGRFGCLSLEVKRFN